MKPKTNDKMQSGGKRKKAQMPKQNMQQLKSKTYQKKNSDLYK